MKKELKWLLMHTVRQCFPTRVPQNIVRGSARNRGIINKNFEIPRKIPNIP
jgi:hypothetical protein